MRFRNRIRPAFVCLHTLSAALTLMLATAVMLPTAAAAQTRCDILNVPVVDWSGCRKNDANLEYAQLNGANLSNANLSNANLSNANLTGANLETANLTGANLDTANLSGAFLAFANLTGANLSGANLTGAILGAADLTGANLTGADLTNATLTRLTFADVQGLVIENLQDYKFDLLASDPAPVVNYGVTARLGANGDISSYLVYDIPSGSSFDDGVTTVTVQVVDERRNVVAKTSFTVAVNRFPATPPVITAPANVDLLLDPPSDSVTVNLNDYVSATDVRGVPVDVTFFFKRLPGDRYTSLLDTQVTALELTEGSYEVLMMAEDAFGQTSSATMIIDVSAPIPATVNVTATPEIAQAGQPRTLRYELTLPAGAGDSADVIFYVTAPTTAAWLPTAAVPMTFADARDISCGTTPLRINGDKELRVDARLTTGQTCVVEAQLAVPLEARGWFDFAPVVVSTWFPGQTGKASTPLSHPSLFVTVAERATVAYAVTPESAGRDDARSVVYTLSLPSSAQTFDSLSFAHDLSSLPAGITFSGSGAVDASCGAGASVSVSARAVSFADGALTPGQSCQVTVPLSTTSDVPSGTYTLPVATTTSALGSGSVSSDSSTNTFEVLATPPVANPDTNTVTESGDRSNLYAVPATGNLVGPTGASAGDVADVNPDAPVAGPVVSFEVNGRSYAPGTRAETPWGWLTIDSTGAYTYNLGASRGTFSHPSSNNVKALKGGETAVETFTYTIENATGQQASSTLTITINGYEDNASFDLPPSTDILEGTLNLRTAEIHYVSAISSDTSPVRFIFNSFGVRSEYLMQADRIDHQGQSSRIVRAGPIVVQDIEGDVSEYFIDVRVLAAPPLDLAYDGGDLIGNPVPLGSFAGTLASNDEDSGLTYALVPAGSSDVGSCSADTGNALFTVTGDQVVTSGPVSPGTHTICGEVTNAGGTYQQSFDITVLATDTVAPTLQVRDITQPLDPGAANALVSFAAQVSDNTAEVITPTFTLDGSPITSPHAFPSGENIVTARAEDAGGNVTTDTFTVTTYPDAPLTITTRVLGGPLSPGTPGTPITYEATLTNPNGVALQNAAAVLALGQVNGALPAPAGVTYDNLSLTGGCGGTPMPVSGNSLGVQITDLTFPANSTCTVSGRFSVDDTTPEGPFPVFGVLLYNNGQRQVETGRNDLTPVAYTPPDSTPPEISMGFVEVPLAPGQSTAQITLNPTVTDNSGEVIVPTFSIAGTPISNPYAYPAGITEVTIRAVDSAGNIAEDFYDVTVYPAEALTLSAALSGGPLAEGTAATYTVTVTNPNAVGITDASLRFALGGNPNAPDTAPAGMSLSGPVLGSPCTGLVSAVQAGSLGGNVQQLTIPAGGSCTLTGTVTVDATTPEGSFAMSGVTSHDDLYGPFDFAAALAPITYLRPDVEAPVLTPPNTVLRSTDAGAAFATVDVTSLGSVADNRTPLPAIVYRTGGAVISGPQAFPLGDTVVTMEATDAAGNEATPVQFIVTVTDDEAPVITAPANITMPTDAGQSFAMLDVTSLGSVTDNRTPLPAIVYRTGGVVISGPQAFILGDTVVTMEAADAAGNTATPVQFTVTVTDGEAPVITVPADITVAPDAGLDTAVVAFSVTASDNVDGDLTGALDITPSSGSVFPLGTTPVAVAVTDAAGNRAEATFTVTVTDDEAPVITPPDAIVVDLAAGEATAIVDFAATVTDNADPAVTPVYQIAGTPITSPHAFPLGMTIVTIDATDSAGNAAPQASFTVTVRDVTAPTIALSADRTTLLAGEVAQLTFTLSEPTTDFTAEDIAVTGGTLTDFDGAGDSYSAVFTPDDDSTAAGIVSVGDNAFSDASGNFNQDGAEADNTLSFTIDTHIPTVEIGPLTGPVNGTFSATITLSRPSSDFTVGDLVVQNATAVLTGSGASYTVVLSPWADGMVSVAVAAGSFSSTTGNLNQAASATAWIMFDSTPPQVTITGLPERFAGQATFELTITFNEDVTGFTAADLALSNATVAGLSGAGAVYAAQITATGEGDVTVQVPADAAFDGGGNGNLASEVLTSINDAVAETQQQISSFMSSRANQLAASQPDLTCLLGSSCGGGTAGMSMQKGALSYNLNSRPDAPVWFRLNGTHSRDGSAESDYLFGALGAHREIGQNTLLGLLFEMDHVAWGDGDSSIEGTGWLVGPYFVTRLPEQPLYVEGRLLGGMSDNRITPLGTYTDRFETRRWLAQLKVSGRLEYGETTLTPSLQASYSRDDQLAYTDSLGNLIPEQGIAQSQVDLGLDFQTPVQIADHPWVLGGGFSAVHSSTATYGGVASDAPNHDGLRGRTRLTGKTVLDNGAQLNLGVSFDGIGADGFDAVGLEFGLEWAF